MALADWHLVQESFVKIIRDHFGDDFFVFRMLIQSFPERDSFGAGFEGQFRVLSVAVQEQEWKEASGNQNFQESVLQQFHVQLEDARWLRHESDVFQGFYELGVVELDDFVTMVFAGLLRRHHVQQIGEVDAWRTPLRHLEVEL